MTRVMAERSLTYDVALGLHKHGLLHCFEGILCRGVCLSGAQMHLRKITPAEEASDREFLLQIKQHHKTLHGSDPVFSILDVVCVQLNGLALGHHDEAIHVLLGRVLKVVALDPGIFDVKNSPFFGVVLVLQFKGTLTFKSALQNLP